MKFMCTLCLTTSVPVFISGLVHKYVNGVVHTGIYCFPLYLFYSCMSTYLMVKPHSIWAGTSSTFRSTGLVQTTTSNITNVGVINLWISQEHGINLEFDCNMKDSVFSEVIRFFQVLVIDFQRTFKR